MTKRNLISRFALSRRTAIAAAPLVFASWHSPGRAAAPTVAKQPDATPDPRIKTYQAYLAAWSAVSDEERARLLREGLSDDIVFTNSMQTRRGQADVAAHVRVFQQRSPGASFEMSGMLGWDNHGLANWQLVDSQGRPGFSGHDVLAFDSQGRIESILMFVRIEKQILK